MPEQSRLVQQGVRSADRTADLVAHYDKLAPRYERLYRTESRLSDFYVSRQACVSKLLDGLEKARALEVGCAAGLTVDVFLDHGMTYHGIDISPGMIDVCRRRFGDEGRVRFSVGNVRTLAFADGAFDVVAAMGVLEYVSEEQRAVDEMARVLKPSGKLIVSGITRWSPYNVFNYYVYRRLKRWQPAYILREYHTEREYRVLLSRAQLQVVDVAYFNFPLPVPSRLLPSVAAFARHKLEHLGSGPLRRLGNGFLVKAAKAA